MNKEQKKFEEVIKKRKRRAKHMRARRQNPSRRPVTKPVVVPVKVGWIRRFTNWIKHFFV